MLKGCNAAITFTPAKPKRHFKNKRNYSLGIPAYRSPRVIINVSGIRYETYEETLANYPNTLLGCPRKRGQFYNAVADEYCLHRNRPAFDAILFFYQSRGILAKPDDVSEDTFQSEVEFYGLKKEWNSILYGSIDSLDEENEVELPSGSFRSKLYRCLENPSSSLAARVLALWCLFVIVFSTITFCIETLPSLRIEPRIVPYNVSNGNVTQTLERKEMDTDYWFIIEGACVAWFTIEYACRVYASPQPLRFLRSLMGLLDVSAVLPFYLTLAIQTTEVTSFSVIRAIRVFRVLRVFKITRYSQAMRIVMNTLYDSSGQLKTLSFTLVVAVVLFSSAMFYAEEGNTYTSIPDTFWWTIITMTAVGYGDVVPVTIQGKLIASACATIGLVLFCLPTPVLVSNFIKYYVKYGQLDAKKKKFIENLRHLFVRPKE